MDLAALRVSPRVRRLLFLLAAQSLPALTTQDRSRRATSLPDFRARLTMALPGLMAARCQPARAVTRATRCWPVTVPLAAFTSRRWDLPTGISSKCSALPTTAPHGWRLSTARPAAPAKTRNGSRSIILQGRVTETFTWSRATSALVMGSTSPDQLTVAILGDPAVERSLPLALLPTSKVPLLPLARITRSLLIGTITGGA